MSLAPAGNEPALQFLDFGDHRQGRVAPLLSELIDESAVFASPMSDKAVWMGNDILHFDN
jgi:hypothetical protein